MTFFMATCIVMIDHAALLVHLLDIQMSSGMLIKVTDCLDLLRALCLVNT